MRVDSRNFNTEKGVGPVTRGPVGLQNYCVEVKEDVSIMLQVRTCK